MSEQQQENELSVPEAVVRRNNSNVLEFKLISSKTKKYLDSFLSNVNKESNYWCNVFEERENFINATEVIFRYDWMKSHKNTLVDTVQLLHSDFKEINMDIKTLNMRKNCIACLVMMIYNSVEDNVDQFGGDFHFVYQQLEDRIGSVEQWIKDVRKRGRNALNMYSKLGSVGLLYFELLNWHFTTKVNYLMCS